MGTFFGNIGHAIAKGAGDLAGEAKRDYNRVTNQQKPDPTHFANGTPVPTSTNTPPINTGPQPIPVGGTTTLGLNQQQQQQFSSAIHSDVDLGRIWDTITGLGGDAWDAISKLLPRNADKSIDWGKVGGDIAGWIKNNKGTIIDGLNAYNQYNRQQQSDKYAKDALDLAKQHYAEKQPLRDAGMAGMLDPHAGTPDLSALKAQGQQGLSIQAPLPVAAPQTNFQNAQKIAGSGSGNPFAQPTPLPVAPSPTPTQPRQPPISRPMTPQAPRPLPVGGPTTPQTPIAAPMPGAPLPVAQSGPMVPQPKGYTTPIAARRPILPFQPFDPNNPQPLPVGTV